LNNATESQFNGARKIMTEQKNVHKLIHPVKYRVKRGLPLANLTGKFSDWRGK